MARPKNYEPKIIEELQRHPAGRTRRQLADATGCSMQGVHKILSKSRLATGDPNYLPVRVVGKGDHGADVWAWTGDHPSSMILEPAGPVRGGRFDQGPVPELGTTLQVTALQVVDGGVLVRLTDADGNEVSFTRELAAS